MGMKVSEAKNGETHLQAPSLHQLTFRLALNQPNLYRIVLTTLPAHPIDTLTLTLRHHLVSKKS